tara:strand:- start:104 stop:685 length:582 start_codon:yes stop_codon:yes gene_type:complete
MSLINYNLILDFFIDNLIPKTELAVSKGNKIFGAFVINKKDYNLNVTGTNNEIVNPLFHGEVSAIFNFFKIGNLNPKDYILISSHEPCSLCLSAITWSGFDEFYYLFPYEDTKVDFNIPHDLNILKEVFNINNGQYIRSNHYWTSHAIIDEINHLIMSDKSKLHSKIDKIKDLYKEMSINYQNNKISNNIPLK